MNKIKKISKDQLFGLRSYRRATITVLSIITFISMWFKVGINSTWHLDDVIVEVIILFILILMGILANVKNKFPIFQARKLKFTRELTYSITAFFSLLFLFIIYKNIADPGFIAYVAELSFHDLCTILVFMAPIAVIVIFLIYFSFQLIDKTKKKSKLDIYADIIEDSLNHYKSLTIKMILVLLITSIWIKIGLNVNFSFRGVLYELISLISIITLWIVGNIDNKLSPLYNCHLKIDKYFFISLSLPYALILIYAIINSNFRMAIAISGFRGIISLLVSMAPLFFVASMIFYLGSRCPDLLTEKRKKYNLKRNKVKENSLISLGVTILIAVALFYYSFNSIVTTYTLENILQAIIVFLPLCVIIYLILYSGIREINK